MALKLKCLRSLDINISPNPEVVKKAVSVDDMKEKMQSIEIPAVEYEEWRRVEVEGKKKMRIVKLTKGTADFQDIILNQYSLFLGHVSRVSAQYKVILDLKANLPMGHIILQMDFAENFTCQTMDEIQSAYWNATSVTIRPVVAYRRNEEGTMSRKNFAFISDINNYNSTAVLAILKILIPFLKKILTPI
ncbi:hypothetical protein SNE40_010768 [Patella caerulea]|uniref:Uncharacterized protein n=1 Tax=Patella caerulea TaxID=87958 RepID=A0AAN8JR34_PATCE